MDKVYKNNYKKDNKVSLSVKEEYMNFLELHSMDLKYMVPWSQYEENSIKENIKKLNNNESIEKNFGDKKRHVKFLSVKNLKLNQQLNQFEENE